MANIELVSEDKKISVEVLCGSVVFKVVDGVTFYWPTEEWDDLDKYVRTKLAERKDEG